MITLNNTEIIIRLSNDRTKVINYDYLNEFFDYISLQQKTANNNDIKEFKKTYKLNEQKIDRNIITECSKDRYYFDQTKLDYFLSGIDKKYISFVYVATDYGDYGRAGTMYNVNDKNKSLKFEKEDSITNPYNILFTLIKNDDQCKLFCQYTRTGIYSPKAVIENLLQKFKETKSEQEVEIMYEIRNIIPSNIIDNYFGKGTYNKMYVYRNTKDHQDDDLNVTGFNEIEKVASKEIGVVVKGLNIAKKIKLNIVRALKSNDIVKAM